MPSFDDNPLRLARLRAGVPLTQLAADVGASRSTLNAIEEGRTKQPARLLCNKIDTRLGRPAGALEDELRGWHLHRDPLDALGPRARAVLGQQPSEVAKYRSFAHWRAEFASSPTAFASLLGVDRAKVADYEGGIRVNGMPQTLSTALLTKLKISVPYLLELQKLEPNDE
jgi:transcriptional regulator with XRE-family HTH domain